MEGLQGPLLQPDTEKTYFVLSLVDRKVSLVTADDDLPVVRSHLTFPQSWKWLRICDSFFVHPSMTLFIPSR